jgi:hypothetical protein
MKSPSARADMALGVAAVRGSADVNEASEADASDEAGDEGDEGDDNERRDGGVAGREESERLTPYCANPPRSR